MKIVVLDRPLEKPGELDWSPLNALGETILYDHCASEQVVQRIGNAEIVLLNKVPITHESLEACPGIRFISVIGTGYNMVDVAAACERGIPVANVPSYGSEAIAQHAIALLLEITMLPIMMQRSVNCAAVEHMIGASGTILLSNLLTRLSFLLYYKKGSIRYC